MNLKDLAEERTRRELAAMSDGEVEAQHQREEEAERERIMAYWKFQMEMFDRQMERDAERFAVRSEPPRPGSESTAPVQRDLRVLLISAGLIVLGVLLIVTMMR